MKDLNKERMINKIMNNKIMAKNSRMKIKEEKIMVHKFRKTLIIR